MYQTSSWYDLQFLKYRMWQTKIDNYRSFFALLPQPSPLKSPKIAGDIIFIHKCTKNIIIWGTVPEVQSEIDRIFYHFGSFFSLLLPKQPEKSKFWKTEKRIWRSHHFIHVYQKSRSYAILFLRYGGWRMFSTLFNFF